MAVKTANAFTTLPPELLTLVAEELVNHEMRVSHMMYTDLRTLAATSTQFRDIAEAVLYRNIFLRSGKWCMRLLESLEARPTRARLIHSFEWRGKYRHELGTQMLPAILRKLPNLQHVILESPAANYERWREDGNWPFLLSVWTDMLNEAVKPEGATPSIRPLQALRTLTLHWNGNGRRYWSVLPLFDALFCHPSLEALTLSCATFPNTMADVDITSMSKTPLTKLILIECDLSIDAIATVLQMPKALEVLQLAENRHHQLYRSPGSQYGGLIYRKTFDDMDFFSVLAAQKHSLRELRYLPDIGKSVMRPRDTTGRGLQSFTQLRTVAIEELCESLEDVCLDASTSPPNLISLALQDDSYSERVDVHFEGPLATENDYRVVQIAIRASQLPNVQHVSFTSPPSGQRWPRDQRRKEIEIAAKIMVAKGKRVQLWSQPFLQMHSFIPPYLDGEQEPAQELIFDSMDGLWPHAEPFPTSDDESLSVDVFDNHGPAAWGAMDLEVEGNDDDDEDYEVDADEWIGF